MQVDYAHSYTILEFNTVLLALTLVLVCGIKVVGVIGNGWITHTLEITLTLFNCFLIKRQKITLTLTL